jgi:exonuclease III
MEVTFASLNIRCGLPVQQDLGADCILQHLSTLFEGHDVDTLLLQELPIAKNQDNIISAVKIAEVLKFKYRVVHRLSKSHLIENADMGLAIFSKYPLSFLSYCRLPQVNFSIAKNGRIFKSHEKGFIFVEMQDPAESTTVTLANGHCPSFQFFEQNAYDYKDTLFKPMETVMSALKAKSGERVLVAGDFNTPHLISLAPRLFDLFCPAFQAATRIDGRQTDYIFSGKGIKITHTSVVETLFDHYACIIRTEILQES